MTNKLRGHSGIFYTTALPAMLLLAKSSHDFPFAPYSKLVIYPLGRSTCEPTSGGRSETDRVSHHQALVHPGAWDSPVVIAICRLIHWTAMWWQSSNSAYNDLAASLGSFFFFWLEWARRMHSIFLVVFVAFLKSWGSKWEFKRNRVWWGLKPCSPPF